MTWSEFRRLITAHFSVEEVRTLCFDLGIDFESLPGEGKEAKVREMVAFLRRRKRIPDLVTELSRIRPQIEWDEVLEQRDGRFAPLTHPSSFSWVIGVSVVLLVAAGAIWLATQLAPKEATGQVAPSVTTSSREPVLAGASTPSTQVPGASSSLDISAPTRTGVVSSLASNNHISLGETVTGTLFINEGNEWIFSDGPATVDITLDPGPFADGLLLLFDPDGSPLENVTPSTNDGIARLHNYRIPDDRDYTVVVRNAKNEQTD